MLTMKSCPGLGGREAPNQPFDFTKLPNIKQVKFKVLQTAGSIQWISTALSTLKPATSPCLTVVRLNFAVRRFLNRRSMERLRDDLTLIEREVARVRHEFAGKVHITMNENIRYRVSGLNSNFRPFLKGPSALMWFRKGACSISFFVVSFDFPVS